MNRPNQFQFEWITDWDSIYSDPFQQQWLSWQNANDGNHVFFHPALCMAWIETYRPLRDIKPFFCIARKDDLLIFMPLVYWKRNWKNAFQRLIVPVGFSDFDYHDPLCNGEFGQADVEKFWFEINRELKKKVVFNLFIVDGLHSTWLARDMKITKSEKCPYIPLTNIHSADDFKQTLPSKLRNDINRRMRRLEEFGLVEFKVFNAAENAEALLELADFLKLHSKKWPNAYKAPEFHTKLIEESLLSGHLHFSVIRINGKTISWRLNFRDSKNIYSYMPVTDLEFNQFSPGKIHLLFCIEDAIAHNIQTYDQLRGVELYKNEWTHLSTEIYNIEYTSKSILDIIYLTFGWLRRVISLWRISASNKSNSRYEIKLTDWQFDWITDWNTLYSNDFQQIWKKWYDEAEHSHVFNHPTLCMAWIDTYRPIRDINPLFCIARYKGITILFPLIRWKRNWKNAFQRLIVPVGYADFDYHDPLVVGTNKYNQESFYLELMDEIQKQTRFDKIDINGIREKINYSGWMQEKDICPYCNLTNFSDKEAFIKSLKTSLRGDLKRQMRRMNEKGTISLYNYTQLTDGNALAVLPQFLEYHCQRWPSAYKAPGFHKLLLERGLAAGIIDFTELRIEDQAVSWHLGFADKGRYYYYMPVIQPEYAALSPGKIHLLYLVNKAIDNCMLTFDHLRGDENYKSGWTNSVQNLHVFNKTSYNIVSEIKQWVTEKKNFLNER